MKTWGRHCLTWRGHQLFRHGARAKDAAATLVLAGLNEAEESVTGRLRMHVRRPPLPQRPSAERPLYGPRAGKVASGSDR